MLYSILMKKSVISVDVMGEIHCGKLPICIFTLECEQLHFGPQYIWMDEVFAVYCLQSSIAFYTGREILKI